MPWFRRAGRIRAVFFDAGGTLFDERDPILWAECASAVGWELEPEALAHWFDETEVALDREGDRWSRTEFWQHVLAGAMPSGAEPERVERFVARLEAAAPAVRLFSDVRGCLEVLRRRGLALGVISNSKSEASIRALLESVDILRYFGTVTSSGTEGIRKPAPQIFHRALERAGVRAEESFYVGNLPNVDARAATAAGLSAVWLHRSGTGLGTDPPEITSLSEIPIAVLDADDARVPPS